MLTPFAADLEVDYQLLKAYTNYVIDKGIHGIVACGVNGEFSSMTMNERKKVIKTTIAVANNRVPVLAAAYSNNIGDCTELIHYAKNQGADAVVITTPFFFRRPSLEGLYNYFSKILEETKDIPIIICSVPIYSLIEIPTNLIENLKDNYDNIVGIKDLSGTPESITSFAGVFPDLSVLVGSDKLTFHGLNIGCDGAVSAIASAFPEYVLRIYDVYRAGDVDKAWIEQEALAGIRSLMKRFPSRGGLKFVLSRICEKEAYIRPPLRNLNQQEKEALAAMLIEHGLPI
jgi:dihydrodipicolinate synthase/N-acetylneuraminate lyase